MRTQPIIAITANTSWYLFNFRSNLIKLLTKEGYEVIAIAPPDKYSEKLTKLCNGVTFLPIKIDQGGTNPIRDIATTISFYKLFKKANISVVLNFTPKNNIYATFAAARLGIPAINNIAGLGSSFISPGFVATIAKFLYKISQKKATHIFFQNEEDQALFLESGLTTLDKTERLPGSGVDLVRFKPTTMPDNGRVCFLLIARLLYEKGVEEFVVAAKAIKGTHPSVDFRIVGFIDTMNRSAVPKSVVEDWHKRGYIDFKGPSDNIEEEISQATCVVLPSYYREGLPRSLLEAAAMGRPIITTNSIGCKETVIDGFNGFLCEPKDAQSLRDKLEQFLALSDEEKKQMGFNSRTHAENGFDENIVLNAYTSALKRIKI